MIRREPLGRNNFIYVSEEHTFGTDAVILSRFSTDGALIKKAVDLGTGCGIIPMLWFKDNAVGSAVGVEIQKNGAEMFKKTVAENGAGDKISVLNADLRDLKGKLPFGEFDLVCCNPPYKAPGAGIKSREKAAEIARHETLCTLDDVVSAAAHLLKFSGRLCLCHRPERLTDIFASMRKFKIEPKRLRLVFSKEGQEPFLVLVEGRLGGKSGLRIAQPLYVEKNGKLSEEMLQIYGDYKQDGERKI